MNEKWEEGYQARLDGAERTHNPYADSEFGSDAMDWETGWECADAEVDD